MGRLLDRVVELIDRILRGAKPAELPIALASLGAVGHQSTLASKDLELPSSRRYLVRMTGFRPQPTSGAGSKHAARRSS
jgi:hypothetical protein